MYHNVNRREQKNDANEFDRGIGVGYQYQT
jgi:hypothetical protein